MMSNSRQHQTFFRHLIICWHDNKFEMANLNLFQDFWTWFNILWPSWVDASLNLNSSLMYFVAILIYCMQFDVSYSNDFTIQFDVMCSSIFNKFDASCSNIFYQRLLYWQMAEECMCTANTQNTLRKHAYSNTLKILPPKNGNFSDKKFWYFSYFCSKHGLRVLVRTASMRWF